MQNTDIMKNIIKIKLLKCPWEIEKKNNISTINNNNNKQFLIRVAR